MKNRSAQHLARIGSFSVAGCLLFAVAVSTSGCSDSESRMTGVALGEASAAGQSFGWSLEDLPASLDLTAEQAVAMKDAIDRLHADLQRAHGKRARGTGEKARGTHESPMMAFLETSSQTLRTDQFLTLCDHLASQRERMRQERVERFHRHREDGVRSEGARRFDRGDAARSHLSRRDRGAAHGEFKRGEWKKKWAEQHIDRRLESLEARTTRRAEFLAGVLQLSEDQTRQVGQVLSASLSELKRNLEGVREGTVDFRSAAKSGVELERRGLAEISSILNEDQLQRFDAIRDLVPFGTNALGGRGRMHF